jgi:hypothetical protein
LYGPSGGGNRETQGRGRRRTTFMGGQARKEVFEQSPYSRDFVSAWRDERGDAASGSDRRGDAGTTSMDDAIVQHYLAPDCPRDLFKGQVFFLNSCDADPLVSMYQLEKIIRYLGGSTALGTSKRVAFVVTQHLSYAKEEKVRAALARGAGRGLPYRLVHPHFILDSAKAGRVLPVKQYETSVAAARPKAAASGAMGVPPAAAASDDDDSLEEDVQITAPTPKTKGSPQSARAERGPSRRRAAAAPTPGKSSGSKDDAIEID